MNCIHASQDEVLIMQLYLMLVSHPEFNVFTNSNACLGSTVCLNSFRNSGSIRLVMKISRIKVSSFFPNLNFLLVV